MWQCHVTKYWQLVIVTCCPPVFSTWSMHILTKLGTDVFSRWHRLIRLHPNTWSVNQHKHMLSVCSDWPVTDQSVLTHSVPPDYLWCSLCLWRPDTWVDAWGTSWVSAWFSSDRSCPCSGKASSLREDKQDETIRQKKKNLKKYMQPAFKYAWREHVKYIANIH